MKKETILQLPKILDQRGNLSFLESNNHIPFIIKRVLWLYDIPCGEILGGYAFRESQEFIIALSGSFDVVLKDGVIENRFTLNRAYYGLYIPKMIWHNMENFSTNSLAMMISSTINAEHDYIRDFELYKKELNL